jgi:hypothetical protein
MGPVYQLGRTAGAREEGQCDVLPAAGSTWAAVAAIHLFEKPRNLDWPFEQQQPRLNGVPLRSRDDDE